MTKSVRPSRRSGDIRIILLVDDVPEFRHTLRKHLERRSGIDVIEAGSALAALTLLEAGGIDVVVSDYDMPGMRGDQLLAEVLRRWPAVRRLMLTGWSTGNMLAAADYEVLDKSLSAWVIVDSIVRLARS